MLGDMEIDQTLPTTPFQRAIVFHCGSDDFTQGPGEHSSLLEQHTESDSPNSLIIPEEYSVQPPIVQSSMEEHMRKWTYPISDPPAPSSKIGSAEMDILSQFLKIAHISSVPSCTTPKNAPTSVTSTPDALSSCTSHPKSLLSEPNSLYSLEYNSLLDSSQRKKFSTSSQRSSITESHLPFPTILNIPVPFNRSGRRISDWYNSLAPSYKNKLDQFRRVFRGTPVDTDRLLVDYSCALSKNNHGLLLQGRMYVTENWICFYSKILQEQKIYLAVKEIVRITKQKTARIIPNAVEIIYSKNLQRFFFTSFTSRERTYAILQKVWENCRNHQTMSIDDIVQQVREIYGDESLAMLGDEDTDGDPDVTQNTFDVISDSSDVNQSQIEDIIDQPSGKLAGYSVNTGTSPQFSITTDEDEFKEDGLSSTQRTRRCQTPDLCKIRDNHWEDTAPENKKLTQTHSAGHLPDDMHRKKRSKKRPTREQHPLSSGGGDVMVPTVEPLQPNVDGDVDDVAHCEPTHDHPGQLYVNTLVPLSVDALFRCIFTDSEFFDQLSNLRGTFNMVQSAWPEIKWPTNEDDPSTFDNVQRTIAYTLSLKQRIGPRTCASIEEQTLLVSESLPGRSYVVDAKVTNQAVPLCNCFHVVSRYCLLRVGRDSSRLSVSSRIIYDKQVFFGAKRIIENTCQSCLTDFFTVLTARLTDMASVLNEDERISGGYMSAPSTNSSVTHVETITSGSSSMRDAKKTRDRHVTRNKSSSMSSNPNQLYSEPSTTASKNANLSSKNKSGSVPSTLTSKGMPANKTHQYPNGLHDLYRPDFAWLLLVVVSLLLCLLLSMVYTRVTSLERLVEQMSSSGRFGSSDPSDIFPFPPHASNEFAQAKLQLMKDLTQTLTSTVKQMQEVVSKVHRTVEILDKAYKTSSEHLPTSPSCSNSLMPAMPHVPTPS